MKLGKSAPKRKAGGLGLVGLCLLLPTLLGGCPTFQNDLADTLETATRSLILDAGDPILVFDTARDSFISATIDLVFDQVRGDQTTTTNR